MNNWPFSLFCSLRSLRPLRFIILSLFLLAGCELLPAEEEAPPGPPLILTPAGVTQNATLTTLQQTEVQKRDWPLLVYQYKGVPLVNEPNPAVDLTAETATFWYKAGESDTNQQITAHLAYRSDHLNLWVEEGVTIDQAKWQTAGQTIEEQIIPTNHLFFGEEAKPGLDGDNRLNILHLAEIGGNTAGYFWGADGYSALVNPYSNQRELLYISLNYAPVDTPAYYEVVTHEHQHLIQWAVDGNEATWLNEGLAELAVTVNGRGMSEHTPNFLQKPDSSLTNFTYGSVSYGGAYLFTAYFYDRFGQEMTQFWASHPAEGLASVTAALNHFDTGLTADEVVADWFVANYLSAAGYELEPYTYSSVTLSQELPVQQLPEEEQHTGVEPYAADYWLVEGDEPVTVVFTGTQQVNLLDTTPHSGSYFWATSPADMSDQTLTRPVDLTSLTTPTATLRFWAWYDIELGWDYAYVSVSPDGETWQTLSTIATSTADPQGYNLGYGYTGVSGSGERPEWKEQTADLSAYVGQQIFIRFQYVTDDATHNQGFAVDDVSIPELGWADDMESGENGWQASGFSRHTNWLPQKFRVQMIVLGDEVWVEELTLTATNTGQWVIPLAAGQNKIVLVVSAHTPFTSHPAGYLIGMKGEK